MIKAKLNLHMKGRININSALERAFNCLKNGEINESQAIFLDIIGEEPCNVKANHGLAITFTKIGNYNEAIPFFLFCVKSEPTNIEYLQGYLKTLIHLGKIEEAREEFDLLKNNYPLNDQISSLESELNPITKLDFFYKYLDDLGVFQYKQGDIIRIESNPKPLLTNSFLNWFETQQWSDKNLLELGSGGSTLYFSNFFNSITSYETKKEWFDKLFKEIPNSVNLIQTESIIESIKILNINDFEVILVDSGENRAKITKILANKNYKGTIFFDNSEWYRNSIRILESVGFLEVPFFGIKAGEDRVSSTSVLFQTLQINKLFKSNWEKLPKFASYKPNNRWDIE